MPVPVSQMWTVASYVLGQKLRGRRRFPLVLMLEPLYRCNLACAGCGKIQYPGHILKKEMPVEDALKAADECGAPMVSIPGGEPLMHSRIHEIVEGLVARRRYVYLCTNALLLKEKLLAGLFKPSRYLTFSVHMDGDEEAHDYAVCREGTYAKALEAIKLAVGMGFRVTTNTTLFQHADPERTRRFFDAMMEVGVEGMMLSPGYSYDKAPDQESFLTRRRTHELFRRILDAAPRRWKFNQSPLFLEFLMGKRHLECTPWGMPAYSIFGWQRPCYLLGEGYARSYEELLARTRWENYGRASGNPKCRDCMVHSGHESSAVLHTFGSLEGIVSTVVALALGFDSRRGRNVEPPAVTRSVATGAGAGEGDPLGRALLEALDFRGDVTLTMQDGRKHAGYLFNVSDASVELFPPGKAEPHVLARAEIAAVERSGRDTADGKSWEAWHRKYVESKARRARGEKVEPIGIESEVLA
jgi:hopanoid biosynthesis associated radical SAM protein HpnH